MTTKTFTVSYTDAPGFPDGTVVDSIVVIVTDPAGVQSTTALPAGTTSTSYEAATVGDYSVDVQAFDANSVALGSPINAKFSVAAPSTVTLSLPSAVSVA